MSLVKTVENIDKINKENYNEDNIYLITQFYISNNRERQKEILYCLKKNIELNLFTKIYLINEREYSLDEMGITEEENKNVQQIIFQNGQRMKYIHPLALVKAQNIYGYIVIANSDIFFDNSMLCIRKSSISQIKSLYALLRFEYKLENETKLEECKLFGPRKDSQDTWIFHSNFPINESSEKIFNFKFGQPGCDNKLLY